LKGFPTTAGPLCHGGDQAVGRKPKAAHPPRKFLRKKSQTKQINGQKVQLAGSSKKD
jgi:hypothetical protein